MWLQALFFSVGLVMLYFGAEWLVRGASSIALKYGIRPLVVGLTIVALGTSMPEFVINFFAALQNEDSLALGNIVGSNICNIAFILGLTAIVLPMAVKPNTLRKEYPIMMGVLTLFYVLAWDGTVTSWDGLILVMGLVAFLIFLVIDARRYTPASVLEEVPPESESISTRKKGLYLLLGIILLAVGARFMVNAAVVVAIHYGIEPGIVGLTVMALGSSLPELAASLVSALKDEADLSIGNILGSNLLNVLFVVGLVSLVKPLQIDSMSLDIHFPVMLAFGVLLFPLAWTGYRITRMEGGILLTGFLGYMVYLFLPYL